ncbi:hypothetical protein LINGRAHAP2_LOCUS23171 [Linum grandiflorum]
MIADRLFYIEHESLEILCTHCGMYGHKLESYPELHTEQITTTLSTPPTIEAENKVDKSEKGDVGAWMMVTRGNHRRRGKETTRFPTKMYGSRVQLLHRGENRSRPPTIPSQNPTFSQFDPKTTKPQPIREEPSVETQIPVSTESPTLRQGSNLPLIPKDRPSHLDI